MEHAHAKKSVEEALNKKDRVTVKWALKNGSMSVKK